MNETDNAPAAAQKNPDDYSPDLKTDDRLTCRKCGKQLEPAETYFQYFDHGFHTKLLRCPVCGEVYIPEELALGKMAEVEKNFEDK